MPLNWQTAQIPFGAGLSQRSDDRASNPPYLAKALDIQFDEVGGVQTRYPFAALGSNITTGGTISTARRAYANGNELVMFDKDTLYSWNAQVSKWSPRGTHLAVKMTEASRFVTTGDQIECDRAELNNIVAICWTDSTTVYLAAYDKTTGASVLPTTAIATVLLGSRGRLTALSTKILFTVAQSAAPGNLYGLALDPADMATSVAAAPTTIISGANFNVYYDVVKIPGADTALIVARWAPTTSYAIVKVTAALSISSSTKARTCDGPIAVSCTPDGVSAQVVRANGTNIQGDLITISSLADVNTGKAIGTVSSSCQQIAAAHRSVKNGGQYRCYVFWSDTESTIGVFLSKTNWVDDGGTLGTQGTFVRDVAVVSRAVDYDGHVYVWMCFAEASDVKDSAEDQTSQVQNTYFLYRDDAFLVGKCAIGTAAGYSPSVSYLPGVALTSGSTTFSWCGTARRIIPLGGNHTGYAARAPHDIVFTFDSNEARRCVRLGPTLYIACGEGLLQYDGIQLTETGFHYNPYTISLVPGAGGATIGAGTYAYKSNWRWDNAAGDLDRSTNSLTATVTTGAVTQMIISQIFDLHVTHKTSQNAAIEVWRTPVNPTEDAPFYLVTSKDPAVTSNPNRYLTNDTTGTSAPTLNDELGDAALTVLETNPENGGILENLPPPPATIVAATSDRIFLAGVSGDPDRVWYSKTRNAGEVAAFHDALVINVPSVGGDITALAFLNETLIVFRQHAIYAIPGDGFDNAAGGQNYGPARLLASDVGAISHETVALTPQGLVFKSSKGWYMLNRGWSADYIGAPVSDYDSDTIVAVHVLEAKHQIRCVSTARVLVWDYVVGQWGEWTISDGLHATIWNGTYHYLTATGPKAEQTSYSSLTYGYDVESSWIKLQDLQGAGACRYIEVLGEYRSAHIIRVRLARDYLEDGSGNPRYFQDKAWTVSPTVVGSALRLEHSPSQQQLGALKVRLTAYATLTAATFATSSGFTSGGAVTTSGSNWTATLTSLVNGTDGNGVTLSVYTSTGDAGIEIRDHQSFNGTVWSTVYNTVGVRIGTGSQTIGALEAAINDLSRLVSVTSNDATPSKTITNSSTSHSGLFTGGAQTYPTGEAAKLTGLALEVGIKPGLFKRLPAAERQ